MISYANTYAIATRTWYRVNLVRVTIEQLHTNLFMYTSVMASFRTFALTLRSGKAIDDRDALNPAESTAIGMRFHDAVMALARNVFIKPSTFL